MASPTPKLRILLTGFEPFGESRINPSAETVARLAGTTLPRIEVLPVVLPVVGNEAVRLLIAAIRSRDPSAVVMLGESGQTTGIAVERVAINLRDYRIADNSGKTVTDQPVVARGPAAYFSTLPVRALVLAVRDRGVPADLSLSAGSFLCNELMYAALHHSATKGPAVPTGFVHLPQLPSQQASVDRPRPTMGLDTTVLGVTALLVRLAELIPPAGGRRTRRPAPKAE